MNGDGQTDVLVRVLGPIDLLTTSGAEPVGGRNARALLGALALGAGRAVSTGALRWAIWGDSPPASADNSLQTYVSRLRHLAGPDTIVRENHAYELVVGRGQIDALRFEDLLDRANEHRSDPPAALSLCREALALWRGDPFGDLCDEEAFRLEALRLEELRLVAVELSLEAELRLGQFALVSAELESAVREHPEREHLWYLLIEALVREGRRREALGACVELRRSLADAGLGAGPELDRLEAIVRSDGPTPPSGVEA